MDIEQVPLMTQAELEYAKKNGEYHPDYIERLKKAGYTKSGLPNAARAKWNPMSDAVTLNVDGFNISIPQHAGNVARRIILPVNINGVNIPYYMSTGFAGKEKQGIPKDRWYAVNGVGFDRTFSQEDIDELGDLRDYWINKGNVSGIATQYNSTALQAGEKALRQLYPTREAAEKGLHIKYQGRDAVQAINKASFVFPRNFDDPTHTDLYYRMRDIASYIPGNINLPPDRGWDKVPSNYDLDTYSYMGPFEKPMWIRPYAVGRVSAFDPTKSEGPTPTPMLTPNTVQNAYLKSWYFDPKHGPALPSNWQLSIGNFPRRHALTDTERKQIDEYIKRADVKSGWKCPYFKAALEQNLTPSTIDLSDSIMTDRGRADFADVKANWRKWITAPQTDIDPTIDMSAEYEKLGYGKKKKKKQEPAPEAPKKPKIRVIKKGTQAPDNQPPITQHRVTDDDYSAPIRDKYEGLADIVAEETGQTQATPEDIGAEIDPTTHKIVGGTTAWSPEFASDWDKKVDAALEGKSDWHKTESAAQQRARENREAFEADVLEDQARIEAEQEARAAGKDYEDYVTQTHDGVTRDSASRAVHRRNEKTRHEADLAQIAERKSWRDMTRDYRIQAKKMAEALSSIAYSSRFRIASHLGRFQTPKEREDYLDAFHIDDPQIRRDVLHAAELEYRRTHDGSIDVIDNVIKKGKPFIRMIQEIGEVLEQSGKSLRAIWGTMLSQAQGVYEAGSYFVPGPLKGASSRLFRAGTQSISSLVAQQAAGREATGALLGSIGGGTALGALTGAKLGMAFGPAGAGVGALAGAGLGLATGLIKYNTIKKQGSIEAWGQNIQSQINLWSAFAELITAPLKLVGSAARFLWNNFNRLGLKLVDTISKFTQLGLPLTALTGVTYGDMQRSYVADAMIGAPKGTSNAQYNSFAYAQAGLYTLGDLDEKRLVSAAMLGVFNDVYGYGGDTQTQYANFINKSSTSLRNASSEAERQRVMWLVNNVDPTAAARIQQLQNLAPLGVTDYRTIQNGSLMKQWKVTQYTANDLQRAMYTKAGMEYTALSESISESKNMIAERLWRAFGKNFMSSVNELFHFIATGGSWRGAVARAKDTIRKLWADIAKEFSFDADFGKQVGKWWEQLKEKLGEFVPILGDFALKFVHIMSEAWVKVIDAVQPIINRLITQLSEVQIIPHFGPDGITFEILNDAKRREKAKEQDWYTNALSPGRGILPRGQESMDMAAYINSYGGRLTPEGIAERTERLREMERATQRQMSGGIDDLSLGTPVADVYNTILNELLASSSYDRRTGQYVPTRAGLDVYNQKIASLKKNLVMEKYYLPIMAAMYYNDKNASPSDMMKFLRDAQDNPTKLGQIIRQVNPDKLNEYGVGVVTKDVTDKFAELIRTMDESIQKAGRSAIRTGEAQQAVTGTGNAAVGAASKLVIEITDSFGRVVATGTADTGSGYIEGTYNDIQRTQWVGNTLRILGNNVE